jgi:hypothetical protein
MHYPLSKSKMSLDPKDNNKTDTNPAPMKAGDTQDGVEQHEKNVDSDKDINKDIDKDLDKDEDTSGRVDPHDVEYVPEEGENDENGENDEDKDKYDRFEYIIEHPNP